MFFIINCGSLNSHEYENKSRRNYNMHNEIPYECYEDGSTSYKAMCKG